MTDEAQDVRLAAELVALRTTSKRVLEKAERVLAEANELAKVAEDALETYRRADALLAKTMEILPDPDK